MKEEVAELILVVPVRLPDGGVLDFVDLVMEDIPGYIQLMIERFVLGTCSWC